MHHPTDRITHTTAFVTPVVEHWLERVLQIAETCAKEYVPEPFVDFKHENINSSVQFSSVLTCTFRESC